MARRARRLSDLLGCLVFASAVASAFIAEPVGAADLLATPEEAYAARGVPRLRFEARTARIPERDARLLERLFALTDEAVVANTNVLRWFAGEGRAGLHFLDYRERIDALLVRLGKLDAPPKLRVPLALVVKALHHQEDFLRDWYEAEAEGRPFQSQLTHEYAWHDGPQRAREALLSAYAELRGLYPAADERTHRAFHSHLRALDLGP